MMEQSNYGLLLNSKDIKLHRKWFEQLVKMIGIYVLYYSPNASKHYSTYTELITDSTNPPMRVGCIFAEHPDQQTLKKMGWMSELQEDASIIHVPYDLPNIQQGALFVIPSGIDNTEGRVFRVSKMTTGMIYPATISCSIVPEYVDSYDSAQNNFKHSSFNLLKEEEI